MHNNYYVRNGLEAQTFIDAFELNFSLGCVVKYVSRCGYKGNEEDAIRDLEKAQDYLAHEIARRKAQLLSKSNLRGLAEREAQQ